MSIKWSVLRNAAGRIKSMGFTTFEKEPGDTITKHDDAVPAIVAEYKAQPAIVRPKLQAVLDLDLDNLKIADLKAVVELILEGKR